MNHVCSGDNEIYSPDFRECWTCLPYTRAQDFNSRCGRDRCKSNEIVTWLGTCAPCGYDETPDELGRLCFNTGRNDT